MVKGNEVLIQGEYADQHCKYKEQSCENNIDYGTITSNEPAVELSHS